MFFFFFQSVSAIKPDIKVVSKDNVPDEKFDKGVIFYLKDGIIVGMVLWNIFNRMMVARQVVYQHMSLL